MILTFDKCLYLRGRLRLTTAKRPSAYMSSRALATTTISSSYFVFQCRDLLSFYLRQFSEEQLVCRRRHRPSRSVRTALMTLRRH